MHPRLQSWAQAQRRATDVTDRTLTGVAWLPRIVQREERMRRASTHPANAHIAPDFAALIRDRDCKAGTFPHSRLILQAEPEVKRLAYCQLNGAIALMVKSPPSHQKAESGSTFFSPGYRK